MPTEKEKKAALRRIFQSKYFKDSPVYRTLFEYLVESSRSNDIPKETTIAIDVFGKDASFNSNKDSTVRYHVHMLRKKLDEYYQNEGSDDKFRIVIPKGRYEIQYETHRFPYRAEFRKAVSFLNRWEVVIILLLLVLNLYLVYNQFSPNRRTPTFTVSSVASNDPIWGTFFDNDYPVSIILGDDFLLDEYAPEYDRYRIVRDWEINSESELYEFLSRYPRANLWKSEISGIPFGGVRNLMDILPVIYQFQSGVSLRFSSAVELKELRGHNIIYIGEFKNLRVLRKVLHQTPIRYQYDPDERLFIVSEEQDTLDSYLRIEAPYEQKNKYNVDYSLLIKIPGVTGENYMFIVGFGYGGRLERTKMLGDAKLRAQLVERIREINSTVPDYFIALFEVKSIERTGFTNEIKYFKAISKDFYTESPQYTSRSTP